MLDLGKIGPSDVPSPYLPPKVSWEEYHDAWDNEDPTEWVDGEIIHVSPENIRHLLLTDFLLDLLKSHVRPHNLGLIMFANFIMRLPTRPSGRMPDIFFVSTERLEGLHETYYNGAADLAIEVVSPKSGVRDRRDKLAEYEAAGIPEYWIVDESRREALFYVLGADGAYALVAPDENGIYTSTVLPGLRLRVSWLWQWPLPDLEDALADLPA